MLPHHRFRRPRFLFVIGLATLCITLFSSYERLSSTAFNFAQYYIPLDIETILASQDFTANYSTLFAELPSMSYDTTARPLLKGMPPKLVDTLPEVYVPTVLSDHMSAKEGWSARRLVIVGDVHGQKKALEDLLVKVGYDNTRGDHLIFTGDLVNKGPDSAGVVALAMELGAHSVRGNHEDRVLLTHAARSAYNTLPEGSVDLATEVLQKSRMNVGDEAEGPMSAMDEYLAREDSLSKGDRIDRETAKSLTPEQIRWLSERPVILRIGPVPLNSDNPTFQDLVVCHAGLVPNISLEDQDPWAVMNMRTINYPIDDLRRDAVKKFLEEKVEKISQDGNNRGKLAALQAIDDQKIDREMQKIIQIEKLTDHTLDVGLPSSGREGTYWYEVWSRFQEMLAKTEKKEKKEKKDNKKEGKRGYTENQKTPKKDIPPRMTVVYGHDAKSGLQVPETYGKGKRGYTFGLDSGCVYGKELSALVIELSGDKVVHKIVQVSCDKAVDPKD